MNVFKEIVSHLLKMIQNYLIFMLPLKNVLDTGKENLSFFKKKEFKIYLKMGIFIGQR